MGGGIMEVSMQM